MALDVLPATVAEDPERLDRFQSEAKALATLDVTPNELDSVP